MGRYAIEKPAVMRYHHHATGEGEQRFFQCTQRLHIEVVGRFIEQQNVAAGSQQLGQVDTVAFAA